MTSTAEIRERHEATDPFNVYVSSLAVTLQITHRDRGHLLDRVEELEKALRPFAASAGDFAKYIDSAIIADTRLGVGILVGDFRAAKRVLGGPT